ncbi:DinI-like family protein [Photorhabdus stackebrandtii]|uniref:DNA damage-inducible protein I n=1 Tax=Photorhabdus stackebrandtii TaxID=1123042 RepID=A0A7X5QMG6_9GAMM|nr:DinI-like family protein [Photorhabdus stackebrandtii]NHB97042.1 DNA damage-inducible protein I [Photorhabdus stackebrandtii]
MHVEVTIDKSKKLPKGAVPALAVELDNRLKRRWPDIKTNVKLAGNDGLSVRGGTPDDRKVVEEILQETWESADDWFQP